MSNKLHFWIVLALLALSLGITLIILIAFKFLPARLPLFYSLPWGDGQLATQQQFLIIPASIAVVTLLNLVISWQLHPSQLFFKKVLLLSPFVVSLLLIMTFVKVVLNFI